MPKPLARRLDVASENKLFNMLKGNKSALDKLATFINSYTVRKYDTCTELIVTALNAEYRLIGALRKGANATQYDAVSADNYVVAFSATYKEYLAVCECYDFKINLNIVGLSRLRRELHVLKKRGAIQLVCKYVQVKQQDVIVDTTPTLTAIIDTLTDYGFVCKHVNTVEHIIKACLLRRFNLIALFPLLGEETSLQYASLLYVASGSSYCYLIVNNKKNAIVVDPDEYEQNCDVYFCDNVGTALSDNTSFKVIHKPF